MGVYELINIFSFLTEHIKVPRISQMATFKKTVFILKTSFFSPVLRKIFIKSRLNFKNILRTNTRL